MIAIIISTMTMIACMAYAIIMMMMETHQPDYRDQQDQDLYPETW